MKAPSCSSSSAAALVLCYHTMSLPLSTPLRMSPHPFPTTTCLAGSSTQQNAIDLSYTEHVAPAPKNANATQPPPPPTPTLFVHGLDSSSHTWRNVQSSLPSPSVALDCRGCGRSPLGDPTQFSPDAVVEDVKRLVNSHPLLRGRKFVLVGHSMGGRVGMCYAAKYPQDVAALVVEDMDVRRRAVEANVIAMDEAKAVAFDRRIDGGGIESVVAAFEAVGYPANMVSRWIDDGRIYPNSNNEESSEKKKGGGESSGGTGGYWSDVNPAFRALCYRHFFDSDSGEEAWGDIAKNGSKDEKKEGGVGASSAFPVHLMVAGVGTVCDEGSIKDMVDAMGDRLVLKRYPEGTHSIHNSVREEFIADLGQIIANVAAATT